MPVQPSLDLCPLCRCPLTPAQRAQLDARAQRCGFRPGGLGPVTACEKPLGHDGPHVSHTITEERT